MNQQEQEAVLSMFVATLKACRSEDAARVAQSIVEKYVALVTPRRSLWERLFGGKRQPAMPVYVLHVEMAEELAKDPKPKKTFRVVTDGETSLVGGLFACLDKAASIRAYGWSPNLQRTDDGGRTWVDVGDDGVPVVAHGVEKTFRVVNDGLTVADGCLSDCRAAVVSLRARREDPRLQMSTDNGMTWVNIGDDGEPLPPPRPVECPQKPPFPPADAAGGAEPKAGA